MADDLGAPEYPAEAEYPAAHSMDTTWFAVDRDGFVAYFESGEAGAVPSEALTDQEEDVTSRVAKALPRTGERLDPAPGRAPGRGVGEQHRSYFGNGESLDDLLMFLDSLAPVEEELRRGELYEVHATEGVAVVWRRIRKATFERLHADGACRFCTYHYAEADDDEPEEDEVGSAHLAKYGFFSYTHLTDNWVAGAYGRDRQPREPVRLEQLPLDLREKLGRVRFHDLSFQEAAYIQPVEHTACEAWSGAYLTSDGKTIRPIPGREDDYASEHEDYADMSDEIEVEPPPAGSQSRPRRPAGGGTEGNGRPGLLFRIFRWLVK